MLGSQIDKCVEVVGGSVNNEVDGRRERGLFEKSGPAAAAERNFRKNVHGAAGIMGFDFSTFCHFWGATEVLLLLGC